MIMGPDDADPRTVSLMHSLSGENEVGVYDPKALDPGRYTLKYVYRIHPEVVHDDEVGYVSLEFDGSHLNYNDARISVEGAGEVVNYFPHTLSLDHVERNGTLILTGSLPEDKALRIDVLLENGALTGFEGFLTSGKEVKAEAYSEYEAYVSQHCSAPS